MFHGPRIAELLLIGAGLLSAPSTVWARTEPAARPPPLEGRTGCELWVGTVSGNDPSVLVEALICEGIDGSVSGQLQWSSLTSGYSIRDISGQWSQSRDKLAMSDSRIVVNKPNPGWRFCTVDQYDLTLIAPTKLRGSYRSSACSDTAKVELDKKVVPAPVPTLEPEEPSPPPASEPEAESRDPKQPAASGCSCRSAADDGAAGGSVLTALALLALTRRRVRRCRRGAW